MVIPAIPDCAGPVVECQNYDCGVCHNHGNFRTEAVAIAAWNRRVPPNPYPITTEREDA